MALIMPAQKTLECVFRAKCLRILRERAIDFEPWLSRAVELSRLRRGAVEPVVEALPVEPVELLSSLSRLTPCAGLSSCREAVEFLSSFSVEAVEFMSSVLS